MNVWKTVAWLFRDAGQIVRQRWRWLVVALGIVVVGALLLLPSDRSWRADIIAQQQAGTYSSERPLSHLAKVFSFWGDYPTGTLIVVAAVWLAGLAARQPQWRTAALACLLSASLAGLEVNVLRFSLGRPRPSTGMADGFYGPSLHWRNQSFPSGHSGTSFGTATALIAALPVVGVPLGVGAVGVAWSRVYGRSHSIVDVWAGAWIGILNGVIFGWAARRHSVPRV